MDIFAPHPFLPVEHSSRCGACNALTVDGRHDVEVAVFIDPSPPPTGFGAHSRDDADLTNPIDLMRAVADHLRIVHGHQLFDGRYYSADRWPMLLDRVANDMAVAAWAKEPARNKLQIIVDGATMSVAGFLANLATRLTNRLGDNDEVDR